MSQELIFWLFWVIGTWRKRGPLFCLTGAVCVELDQSSLTDCQCDLEGAWWIHHPESAPSELVPGDWGLLQSSNSDKSAGQREIIRLPRASAGRQEDTRPIYHLSIEVLGVTFMSKWTHWDPVATLLCTDGQITKIWTRELLWVAHHWMSVCSHMRSEWLRKPYTMYFVC